MASINWGVIQSISEIIKETNLSGKAPDFTDQTKFPAAHSPGILDYIFAVTLLEFGSWKGDKYGYREPVIGEVNGRRLKGSDLLWTLSMEVFKARGPKFFSIDNLAQLEMDEFHAWIPDESGYQDIVTRYNLVRDYANFFVRESTDPEAFVRLVNLTTNPLRNFIFFLAQVPGYNMDILYKKNFLLAMILAYRPEKFLKARDADFMNNPIVDTHLMRVALRLGLINVSANEEGSLSQRRWVAPEMEQEIRQKVFSAVRALVEFSGKSMREIDFLLWSARDYCPEMSEPDCSKCVFESACQKKTKLFQPVLRTINY